MSMYLSAVSMNLVIPRRQLSSALPGNEFPLRSCATPSVIGQGNVVESKPKNGTVHSGPNDLKRSASICWLIKNQCA